MNEHLNSAWYVFYNERNQVGVKMIRIGSNCLGNAITAAKEVASRCSIQIIGVAPDLGEGKEVSC